MYNSFLRNLLYIIPLDLGMAKIIPRLSSITQFEEGL